MTFVKSITKSNLLLVILFILSLTSALFYTGNNVWLFSVSYLLISLSIFLVLRQRFYFSTTITLNGLFISAILLLSWFFASIFLSQIQYLSLFNFFWVGSLIIVFLIFTFADNKDQIWKQLWPGILGLVFIWASYGLIQYYYLHTPSNATFLNRNTLAALVNLALLPAVAYFLLSEEERPWKFLSNKILSLILIILFLCTFIITSRGATVSLITGFIILFFFIRKQLNITQLYSFLVILFIAFMLATFSQYFMQNLPSGFTDRMLTLQNSGEAGNTRFIIWKSLLPLFNEMPWYGLGLGSLWVFWPPYRPASDHSAGFFAHNDYMQLTLEAGYPGIILLFALFIFILLNVIRALKTDLTKVQHIELIALFSALVTYASHSFFTYNFYILPLLIISGLYLARLFQLSNIHSTQQKNVAAIKTYFNPLMFFISLIGFLLILLSYFFSVSLSDYYNKEAKDFMHKHKLQDSNAFFIKAQKLTPLMDNPFFSHADLLRRAANNLYSAKKDNQAAELINLAHKKLDEAQKLNPLRPQTHHIRGLIYERDQLEKAKIEFEKALKLDPRFLFSRIRLATLHHQQGQLKAANKVLYDGVNYTYQKDKVMLEYMQLLVKYSKEAKIKGFSSLIEENIKQYFDQNSQN